MELGSKQAPVQIAQEGACSVVLLYIALVGALTSLRADIGHIIAIVGPSPHKSARRKRCVWVVKGDQFADKSPRRAVELQNLTTLAGLNILVDDNELPIRKNHSPRAPQFGSPGRNEGTKI